MTSMRRAALITGLSFATLAGPILSTAAEARDRSSTVTTQRGTYSGQTSKSCAGGTCSREQSVTGPNGKAAERSGSVTKTAPGSYSYSKEATGLQGRSIERSGTVTVTPGN